MLIAYSFAEEIYIYIILCFTAKKLYLHKTWGNYVLYLQIKFLKDLDVPLKAPFGLLHTVNYYFPCTVRPKMGWGQELHNWR